MTSPFTNIPSKEITIAHTNGLRELINNCDSSLFNQHCLNWYIYLCPVVQRSSTNPLIKEAACACLNDLVGYAAANAFLSRELVTKHLSSLIEHLTTSQFLYSSSSAFLLLGTIIQSFPGISGQFGGKIEKRVVGSVDTNVSKSVLQAASKCLARLPFAGKQIKREERCSEFQDKILGSVAELGKHLCKIMETNSELDDVESNKKIGFQPIKYRAENLSIISRRCHFLLYTFEAFLSQKSPCTVSINILSYIKMLTGFLSINCVKFMRSSNPDVSQCAKFAFLIQSHMWCVLRVLITVMQTTMALHSPVIINLACQHLEWTKSINGNNPIQTSPIFIDHRANVYQFLGSLFCHVGLLALVPIYENRVKLVGHFLTDIKPAPSQDVHSNRHITVSEPVIGGPSKNRKKKKNQKQKRSVAIDEDCVFSRDVKVNLYYYVTLAKEAWSVLTLFWRYLANFMGQDPLPRSDNTIVFANKSVLNRIQWTVEKLLTEIISKPGVEIVPYGHVEVLLPFLEFLDIFHVPTQSACPIEMSLVASFVNKFLSHHDGRVRTEACRIIGRMNACVASWTRPLSRVEDSSNIISQREAKLAEEMTEYDDDNSCTDEDVEMETQIVEDKNEHLGHIIPLPIPSQEFPVLISSQENGKASLIQNSTNSINSFSQRSELFTQTSEPVRKKNREEQLPTSQTEPPVKKQKTNPLRSTEVQSLPSKINSEVPGITRKSPRNQTSSNADTEIVDSEYVPLEDMLATFVDT